MAVETLPHSPAAAAEDGSIELIFLGTGTSSTLPHVDCLTAPPGAKQCRTCLSTLKPEGKKNVRRNTSAVLRVPTRDGELATIVIDVGKSFQQAAVEWFPKHGLRKIDAVFITHAHADAMNGLDDLRGWTLHGAIQPYIDVYVSPETYEEVERAFPYLVDKMRASGGGDVPEFRWHLISDRVPCEIGKTGIVVHPFLVHHGRVFSEQKFSISPMSTHPSTPGVPGSPVRPEKQPLQVEKTVPSPYFCFGFTVQNAVTYISDTSHIPEDVWDHIFATYASRPPSSSSLPPPAADQGRPPVLVLDCLRLEPHTSHLSLAQAVEIARRMGAHRTYLTGFSHEVSHEEYRTILEAVGGRAPPAEEVTEMVRRGLETIEEGPSIWVRPAFDGLKVVVEGGGKDVRDEEYV
ncbi:beta-lactamase-like protein [Trametes punicea]|nr:beta-lactamase-like protein [Trametes punicea]